MKIIKDVLRFLWETGKLIAIALLIIIPLRAYVVQPFFVRGSSMEPSYEGGEYLIIDELSYHFREPQRGEVVVFRYPADPRQFYIKRIIGLPSETLIIKGRTITVINESNPQGFLLDERAYIPDAMAWESDGTWPLGESDYFVLGDNRSGSSDSRRWGVLSRDHIVGRTLLRAWPINRAQAFAAPSY